MAKRKISDPPRYCLICRTQLEQRGKNFCSQACSGKSRLGPNHPRFKGGTIDSDGYRRICVNGKQVLEHRHIMSKHIGRDLLPTEVVHHKNENPLDNSLDNLELLPSQSVHMKTHRKTFISSTHRECSKCHEIKSVSDFYSQGTSHCKICYCAERRQWRIDHPEQAREIDRRYNATRAMRKLRS